MEDNLESIPTSELVEKAARTPLEKAIVNVGCVLAFVLNIGTWIAVFGFLGATMIEGLCPCFFASCLVLAATFSAAKFLAGFRGHKLLRELDRRFGRWSIRAYIRYYRARLGPGEARCIFSGQALPKGRRYWGCIEIDDTGAMVLEAARSAGLYFGLGPDPWSGTERGNGEIAADECVEIGELIASTKGTGKSEFSSGVRDGFPARLAVIFGDGSESTIISSNLGGLSDELQRDDRIRLLKLMAKVVCDDLRFGVVR